MHWEVHSVYMMLETTPVPCGKALRQLGGDGAIPVNVLEAVAGWLGHNSVDDILRRPSDLSSILTRAQDACARPQSSGLHFKL